MLPGPYERARRRRIVESIGAEAFERLATELTGSELRSSLLALLPWRACLATGLGARRIAVRFARAR